jgi:hypothetical protein
MRMIDVLRLAFAIIFLLGAIANTYMGLATPSVYETFADDSIVPLYRNVWDTLVYPRIQLCLVPVVLIELSIAWLLLKSGTHVKVGLGIALAFLLFVVPFWWQGGAVVNLLLALVLLWLLRHDYPGSISFKGK